MCGIAGCVVRPGADPPRDTLVAMREALRHRGPDDAGIVVVDNVGLVHTRLSIVDVSDRAHQPMRHPGGALWLSFNGEIFNHRSLRAELADGVYLSTGDTETLLHAWAGWGPETLPRLNGQFAFAALDLDRGSLFLARDRLGIKPLYLFDRADGVWFASEPAALLPVIGEPSARPAAWPSIVDLSCYRAEDTLIEGVRRLPPGTSLEIPLDGSPPRTNRWYTAAGAVSPSRRHELAGRKRSDLASQLADTLRAAVHDALMGDVPMGTLCSGGVDSAVITALAAEVKPDLVAFSASRMGDRTHDESQAARRVADRAGIELDLMEVDKEHWRSGFVEATIHFGGPMATASSVTIAQMAERARRRGIKVLLTGEGADELFGGYGNPFGPPLGEFLSPGSRLLRLLEPRLFGHLLPSGEALARRVRRLVDRRSDAPSPPGVEERPRAVEEDAAVVAQIEAAYSHHTGPRHEVETGLLRDLHFTLSWLLNRMDTNMMQASVEARVPFLDPRVVDLVVNLPLEARVSPWNKGILRDVARRLLPLQVAHRAKVIGMDYDAGVWIEEAANPKFLAEGLTRELWEMPRAEFARVLASADASLRVRIWSTEVWCRSVFGGVPAPVIESDLWGLGP